MNGNEHERRLVFEEGSRLSVGRTKENDLAIEEISVSKVHASLAIARDGNLIVADTGSTNGTFINGERIFYGKAKPLLPGDSLKFGSVEVKLEVMPKQPPPEPPDPEVPKSETFSIGDFEFTRRLNTDIKDEAVPTALLPEAGTIGPGPTSTESDEPEKTPRRVTVETDLASL